MKKIFLLATLPLLFASTSFAAITPGSTNLGAIWFVGDSITQSNLDNDSSGSPRSYLYEGLNSAGYTFTYTGSKTTNPEGLSGNYIYHDGISGSLVGATNVSNPGSRYDHTAELSNSWVSGRLATVKPDIVLLMLGTNDINNDTNGNPPQETADKLLTLVNNMYALPGWKTPTVFISTIAPNRQDGTKTTNTIAYNALLPGVVQTLRDGGKDVYLLDAFTPLNNSYAAMMNGDNLHPNAAGNQVIANTWLNGIESRVSAVPEPSTYGLLGAGALGAAALVRRRKHRAVI